jgi:benzylsuccinate CoA-transferase BbsF subunit
MTATDGPATATATPQALAGMRICDFTGQLAGAGATKILAGFGAEVIRIEDPVREGKWDILRGSPPFVHDHRGLEAGGSFNNHNAGKLGITLNLRTDEGKELLGELVAISDAVTDNFAAGVLDRLGFGYDELMAIRDDIVYVSNSGFGATGPYAAFKSWGPIAQAVSGLTFQSGHPDLEPAGWGYSFMDHTGSYYMAIAIMLALLHRRRTGEGQWVDLACIEAAGTLHGPVSLDATVNGRPARREAMPASNRSQSPAMAPHGVYPSTGEDEWIAVAVRDDDEWRRLAAVIGEPWCADDGFDRLAGRLADEDRLDELIAGWSVEHDKKTLSAQLVGAGIPAAPVLRPQERVDGDPRTEDWGLWPTVDHSAVGPARVEGLPVHLSLTDWHLERGAPCLGEHNAYVIGDLLGRSADEIEALTDAGVL